jgi:hypothetical protein
MNPARRHGLTFSLHLDPDGPVWLEVLRDRDGAILEFAKLTDPTLTLEAAVDGWLSDQLEEMYSHIEIEHCRACNTPYQQRPFSDEFSPRDELAWRFDLCIPCAERLAIQNPWLERQPDLDHEEDTEDW